MAIKVTEYENGKYYGTGPMMVSFEHPDGSIIRVRWTNGDPWLNYSVVDESGEKEEAILCFAD